MGSKTLNDVNVNITLKPQTTRANLLSTKEDLAVQMGKLQKWYESLVPTGGETKQILAWNSDGTAKWDDMDSDYIKPIASKTFTDIIATVDNAINSETFYFGVVKPDAWGTPWLLHYRVKAYVPGQPNYYQAADVTFYGITNAVSYRISNVIRSTSYRPAYYHNIYRCKEAGIGYGHAIGESLYSSANPKNTSYKRTFEIEILEVVGGTFTFFDDMLLYASIPGTGSTNYDARADYNFSSTGTFPDNNTYDRTLYTYATKAAGTGVKQYSIMYRDKNGMYSSLTTNSGYTTTKTFYSDAEIPYPPEILYYAGSTDIAVNANVCNSATYATFPTVDMRYSDNITSSVGYTTRSSLYLECDWDSVKECFTIGTSSPYKQTFTSGKYYIYLGDTASVYQLCLHIINPVFYYDGTKMISVDRKFIDDKIDVAMDDFIPLSGSDEISGSLKFNKSNAGVYLKDKAGNVYAGINDNGANFWVGASGSDKGHHVGRLYLAAGYDNTELKGFITPYVYTTNADNTAGGSVYPVFHSGNLITGAGLDISLAASSTYSGYVYSIAHTNSVTAVTSTSLLKFQYDAQGHITGSSAITKADITGLGIPDSDTNNHVLQSNTTTANYRPILMGYTNKAASAIDELSTTVTEQAYVNTKLYTQPSTGKVFSDGGYYINESSISYPVLYEGNVKHIMPKTMTDSWTDIGLTSDNTFRFKVVRGGTGSDAATPPDWWGGINYKYGSGIAFGTSDSGGSISLRSRPDNTIPGITFAGGGRSSSSTKPNWYLSLTGTSEVTYDLDNLPGKYAFVYDISSDFASYAWHKFAEVTVSEANADAIATFLVSQTWKNGGDPTTKTGILTAHIRTSGTKVFSAAHFKWLVAGDSIDPTEFVMVYTDTASTSCKVELWHKQTERYDGWVFKLLKEHSRTSYGSYPWKMYVYTESTHGLSTYTSGTGTIVSSLNTIANTAASSDKINTDAGNANTPVYFSGGIPVAVTLPESGAWWSSEPHIDSSGVLEIGRYIDFHATNASVNNYDVRLDASSTSLLTLSSNSGTPAFRISGTLPRLRFTQTTSGKEFDNANTGIWCQPVNTNGVNMFMQSFGNMMIGSGEFCTNAYARKDSTGATQVGYDDIVGSTTEKLYLGADNEVQIISNGQNIGTYSNNDHKVWKFQTDGKLLTPNAITDSLDNQHTMIEQVTRSNSNMVHLAQWNVDGAGSTTYKPGISFHNNGGDTTDKGAIILRPYHHNADPWATGHPVGLYIGKGILTLDGTNVSLEGHTHNYAGSSSAGGSATTVQGTLTNPTSETNYPIPFHATVSTAAKTLRNNDGLIYLTKAGTASADGFSIIRIGNGTASGTAGNKYGAVRIYSTGTNYAQIKSSTLTANRTATLPDIDGEIQVSSGQELIYSARTSGTSFTVTVTDLYRKYRVILIEVYGGTGYSWHAVWPLNVIKNVSASEFFGFHVLDTESGSDVNNNFIIQPTDNGFTIMAKSGSFPTSTVVRVYSLI